MNRAASANWAPRVAPGRWWLFPSLLLLGSVATALAAVIGNGSIVLAIAPVALTLCLAALWFTPLRIPLLITIFLSLALDATTEGPWDSPLAPIGALLGMNLDFSWPGTPLPFPGIAVVLVGLMLLHLHRRLSGSSLDAAGAAGVARPMLWGIAASGLSVVALCAIGFRNGGDLKMAKIQVQSFVLLLLMGYLLAITMRGRRDHRILAIIIVLAACIKSLMALYVMNTGVLLFDGTEPPYATAHGDSILFTCALAIMAVRFAEAPTRRNAYLGLLTLPLLVAGIAANNRRLAWVEVAAVAAMFCVVSRRSITKRFLANAALIAVPLAIVYVAAGWNSQAGFFAPVKLFRSVQDAQVDPSTLYRELENYNLLYTIRYNPFAGTGFGYPFAEIVKAADISFFREYQYMPHNSILGLWAYGGTLGFTGLSIALLVAVFLAARSYRLARSPDDRVAAFMVMAMVLIYEIQCWGDIGFSERRSIVLVSAALAVAGQLAVSTGAWTPVKRSVGHRRVERVVD